MVHKKPFFLKTFIFFILCFLFNTLSASAAIYYIAPTGNDVSGNGSITTPWASIEKLSSVLQAGDTGYVRGGTYRSITPNDENKFKVNNLNGTSTNLIKIWAYPGEKPVFNLDNIPATQSGVGFYVSNSAYIHLKGLRVTGLKQCTSGCSVAGMILYRVDNSIVELFEIDNIEGYGLYLQGPQNPGGDGSDNNLIKNVDVHHIGDRYSGWGGANGFNITGGDLSNNNVFDGCRIWWSSDDGFDFFGTNIYATIKNSWSFWNGYVPGTFNTAGDGYGFKLGPAGNNPPYNELKRVLTNNLAFENRIGGFDQNSGTDNTMRYRLHNNTSFGNGQFSYFFGANTSIPQDFKNNIAVGGSINGNEILSGPNVANNSWNGNVTANNSDFVSVSARSNPNCLLATVTDTNCPNGPRQADGSLPDMNFLKLTSTSDLINAGTNVGLPYSGSAPDIGAFEYGGTSTTPTDTTAPTVPTNLSATGTTQTQTTLSWTASTDAVGVSGYRVFRNGTQIATSATTSYTATGLTAATTYSFTVSAYDAAGNVSTQSTAVSVTTASTTNTAPTANAGADQTITLPTSSVTLTGSGTDVGGSISSYSWTKVSTLAGTITSPSSASTTITGLVQGTHTFRLTVTDNGGLTASDDVVIIVNPAVTTGGIFVAGDRVQVYGGSVRVRSGATTSASSLGTQTSGKLGTIVGGPVSANGYIWWNVNYDTGADGWSIQNRLRLYGVPAETTPPSVSFLIPSANAVLSGTTTISASASDTSGISRVEFYYGNSLIATDTTSPYSTLWNTSLVSNNIYSLSAKAYDSLGNIGNTTISVSINNASTTPTDTTAPTVPTNLSATGTTQTQTTLSWTASTDAVGVSGYRVFRNGTQIATSATTSYTATGLTAATTYSFTVSAYDAAGNVSTQSTAVSVTTASTVVNSGTTIPTNTMSLDQGYSYQVVNSFGGALADTVSNGNQSQLRLFENGVEIGPAHSYHQDVQQYGQGRFSHWNDGANTVLLFSSSDNTSPLTNGRTYSYTNVSTANTAPTANAGADQTITLPTSSVTLTGSGTDSDGTIASYAWTKISGGTATITSPSSATTTVTGLTQGTYSFWLTVTDNAGSTNADAIIITVNPGIVTTTIPTNTMSLDQGYSYQVVNSFGGALADTVSNGTQSQLRLFENGVEIGPAHSYHQDVQQYGQGRFSHWNDGANTILLFSASNNTNPLTNGRVYSYRIN